MINLFTLFTNLAFVYPDTKRACHESGHKKESIDSLAFHSLTKATKGAFSWKQRRQKGVFPYTRIT